MAGRYGNYLLTVYDREYPFAWLGILGISFTILSDYLAPILIAVVVFALLVAKMIPKRG